MFSVSRNAINKRYIHLTLISCKILNGRHEITKVIISSLIIQIDTGLFPLTICFCYQGMQLNKKYIYSTHAKFEMAAMKSLRLACTRQ